MAQLKTDSFFNYSVDDAETRKIYGDESLRRYSFNFVSDIEFSNMNMGTAPVGEGLVILTSISMIYLVIRRKEDVK